MSEIKSEKNIGIRIFAGIVDYSIIYLFKFILLIILGEPDSHGMARINGFPALLPVFFWFIMTVGLEQWNGKTIGNLLVGLKPIPINGNNEKLTMIQSIKRHLLDPIDMFFFGIGAIIINKTEKNQRLGDIWAKTIVVKIAGK